MPGQQTDPQEDTIPEDEALPDRAGRQPPGRRDDAPDPAADRRAERRSQLLADRARAAAARRNRGYRLRPPAPWPLGPGDRSSGR